MNDDTKKQRVTFGLALLMLGTAGIFDLLSLIQFVNIVITLPAWFMFWLWFKIHRIDIGFGSPKRLLTMAGGSLIEFIPILSVLPAWIAAVGTILALVYLEDKAEAIPVVGKSAERAIRVVSRTKTSETPLTPPIGGAEKFQRRLETGRTLPSEGPPPIQDMRPKEELKAAA